MRKEDEIQRATKAFQDAVAFADRLDRGAGPNNHYGNGNNREQVEGAAVPHRGLRPNIPVRTSVNQYTMGELIQLLRWIASDGQLRTDDQIIDEMVVALGFSRRGARIEKAVQSAITYSRPKA